MPNLSEISNGTKLVLGAGVLLLIAMFLPWQDFGNELTEAVGVDASFSAWRGIGIFMGLALIALLAWVVIQVLNVKLNIDLPITEAWLTLGLGVAVFALAVIKLLTILGDEATIWSYVGVVLAALVALGTWLRAQELGGIGQAAMAGGAEPMTPSEPMSAREPEPMSTREPETGGSGMATPVVPPLEPAPPAAPAEQAAPGMPAEPMPEPAMDDDERRDRTRPEV